MPRFFSVFSAILVTLPLLVSTGCDSGPPVGEVTGTVTMDGEPLDNALVTFVPQDGGQNAMGKTDASGQYRLYRRGEPGALIGVHKVSVTTISEPGSSSGESVSADSDAYMEQAMGANSSDYDQAKVTEPIPERYNAQSELTKDVEGGEQVIDLELTSE